MNKEDLTNNKDVFGLLEDPLETYITQLFEDLTDRDKATIKFNNNMLKSKKKSIKSVKKEYKDTIKRYSEVVTDNNEDIKGWNEKINVFESKINEYTKINTYLNTSIKLYEKELNKINKSK